MSESFFKRLKRRLNWTDIGFSAADEERFNDEGIFTPREIVLTVNIDPATGDMVAPGAGAIDPTIEADFAKLAFTLAKKTNPVLLSLTAQITTTNQMMTLESPLGTDYSVPASKVAYLLRMIMMTTVAGIGLQVGYGDTGVANGVADPTALVVIIGGSATTVESALISDVANKPQAFNIYASIPAGKFPLIRTAGTSASKLCQVFGVEVDV